MLLILRHLLLARTGVTYLSTLIALPLLLLGGSGRCKLVVLCSPCAQLRDLALRMATGYHVTFLARARASTSTVLATTKDLTGTDSSDCTTYWVIAHDSVAMGDLPSQACHFRY